MAEQETQKRMSIKQVFKKMTPALFAAWMITSLLNIMFGYDTTSFAGVQSIPSFARQFGGPDGEGGYALPAWKASFMSSVGFAGKLAGCLTAALPIERVGHRYTMWAACVISWVGIIIEATSSSVAQFVAGRIIIYYSVGVAEVTAPMYQAELAPAPMRGTVCGSLQLFNQFGQITAAGVNERFHLSTVRTGWVIPIVVQVIAPCLASIGLFFIPDAPRWLLSKGRFEDAVNSLERVRPLEDRNGGYCRVEAQAIRDALRNKTEKRPWSELFRGTDLRRTSIVCIVLALQQFTGQGFVSQYSPRFYKAVGLGEYAFDYNIASATAGAIGALMGMIASDVFGRRDLLIWGAVGQALFLFLVAGLGSKANPSTADAHGLVASVILFIWVFTGTWPPASYALGSELGTAALREKTLGLGIAVNVVAAFIVAFVVPYLINAIGANIGWMFGGIAIISAIYSFLCVPETKNRSLEEMDELFEAKLPARKFKSFKTVGAGHRIAELERDPRTRTDDVEVRDTHVDYAEEPKHV